MQESNLARPLVAPAEAIAQEEALRDELAQFISEELQPPSKPARALKPRRPRRRIEIDDRLFKPFRVC